MIPAAEISQGSLVAEGGMFSVVESLEKTARELGVHTVFMSEHMKQNLNQIFRNIKVSDDPSFYVFCPRETDPGSAPEGGDTISVIVPVGHLHRKNKGQWESIREQVRQRVLDRLEQEGLRDLSRHIKFEKCLMPETWEKKYHLAVFGSISHFILQMGYFRPHNRHRTFRNLYFTGGSTHPGNGVPLVLMSAALTSERIIKEQQNVQ